MLVVTLAATACRVVMDRQRLIAEREHALRQLESTIKANQSLPTDIYEVRESSFLPILHVVNVNSGGAE